MLIRPTSALNTKMEAKATKMEAAGPPPNKFKHYGVYSCVIIINNDATHSRLMLPISAAGGHGAPVSIGLVFSPFLWKNVLSPPRTRDRDGHPDGRTALTGRTQKYGFSTQIPTFWGSILRWAGLSRAWFSFTDCFLLARMRKCVNAFSPGEKWTFRHHASGIWHLAYCQAWCQMPKNGNSAIFLAKPPIYAFTFRPSQMGGKWELRPHSSLKRGVHPFVYINVYLSSPFCFISRGTRTLSSQEFYGKFSYHECAWTFRPRAVLRRVDKNTENAPKSFETSLGTSMDGLET
jgi:hypothetical protein